MSKFLKDSQNEDCEPCFQNKQSTLVKILMSATKTLSNLSIKEDLNSNPTMAPEQ